LFYALSLCFLAALLSTAATATTTSTDGNSGHHDNSHGRHFNRAPIVLIEHSLAQKRVRVVQLLVVGVVGIVFGGLGNFFVSDSCHFLSIPAPSSSSTSSTSTTTALTDDDAQDNNNNVNGMTASPFVLHFGIWKYSPVESSAMGYPYCIQYGEPYPEPIASRIANSLSLLCAVLSMIILWWYLIVGIPISWSTGVYAAAAAGIFQLLTPILFVQSRLCRRAAAYGQCQTGPSVILSCFVGVLWLIVAAELHYNAPLSLKEEVQLRLHQQQQQQQLQQSRRLPNPMVVAPTSLELADFKDASLQFWHRFHRPPTTPLTTTATDRCRLK
jgi:hypothetical protein